jgi:hypothetical protein
VIFYAGAPLRMPSGYDRHPVPDRPPTRAPLDKTELAILGSLRDLLVEELINPAEAPMAEAPRTSTCCWWKNKPAAQNRLADRAFAGPGHRA